MPSKLKARLIVASQLRRAATRLLAWAEEVDQFADRLFGTDVAHKSPTRKAKP